MSFPIAATLLLIGAKAFGYLPGWPWWMVMLPIAMVWIVCIGLLCLTHLSIALFNRRERKRRLR